MSESGNNTGLGSIADPRALLDGLFAHSPIAFQVYGADGRCLLVNRAFRELFGSAPPPEYNVLEDDVLERQGFLDVVRRAFAGETVIVPPHWYDPRELRQLQVSEGKRVGVEATLFPLRGGGGGVEHVGICFKDVTAELELRSVAEALRRNEEELAITLNSIGDAVIATDTSGNVTRMNPVAEELTGWTDGQAVGRPLGEVFRIFNEDTRKPVESPVERVIRDGVVVGLANHTVLVSRQGVVRAIADSGAPIRDAAGALRGVVLVFRDQREEREAELALRASEARKRAILEAALDSIVTADHKGRVIEFNPAAERTFGYSRSEAIGKQLVDLLVPPSLRAEHLAGFERYLSTGKSAILGRRIEIQALHASGTELPVELTVVATESTDADGLPTFTAYIRDLTAKKRDERALAASKARFEHLVESGIIGVIVADTLGNVHEANDAFLNMVGYSRDELVSGGVSWADMTPPEWRHLDDAAITELARTGRAGPWEKEYLRKNGTRVPVLVGVAMLDLPNAIAFVLDLSEQKKAVESGARAESALQSVEEQLRQAQKMEAVGRLAGGVAHDFNNILTVIAGHSEMLLGQFAERDQRREDIQEIARAAGRASNLTKQLLAFSRQQVLAPQVLDLNETVRALAAMTRRLIGEDIEVALELRAQDHIHVDPGQMEQVLMNLVINARDAMPHGGRLTIETSDVEVDADYASRHLDIPPGRYVVLAVSDNGSGMDEATRSRIFEPFFTTKEQGKGTGLGLSTAFGVVKQSGGTIWVYSEVGQGTTFKVYMPRADDDRATTTTSLQPSDAHARSETVLLVEDDEQVRALVKRLLAENGYHVLDAASGGDALVMAERFAGAIHLLLTDVVLPGMGGRQLVEQMHRLRPETKTIFMSGYTNDAIVRHGVLTSSVAFIQKPIVPGRLLAMLRQVLDKSG